MSDSMHQRIENDFTYHPPKENQKIIYQDIRKIAKDFAYYIADHTPASREQSLALTHLEETVMWANASIARNE